MGNRGELTTVGAERREYDRPIVSFKGSEEATAWNIPKSGGMIGGSRDKKCAVRTEKQRDGWFFS